MPYQESDISWQVLRRIVQDWAGTSAELSEVRPLVGGCINLTLALKMKDGQRAVIKVSPHRVNLAHESEAYQLNLLRDLGLPVPQVYAWKIGSLDDPFSYLLMEFINGTDLVAARQRCSPQQYEQIQEHLAELVLTLHERTAEKYMRLSGPQPQQFDNWIEFYHHVYDPIWREVEKSGVLPVKCRKQIGKVHEKLPRLIAHQDVPRLVHWDIWGTNVLVRPDDSGRWRVVALLDPNCRYAHAEAEIAYMELFHTITGTFLKAYQKKHPLPAEYARVRKLIYQVYPLLNHVRLFGNEYLKPLTIAAEKTSAVV